MVDVHQILNWFENFGFVIHQVLTVQPVGLIKGRLVLNIFSSGPRKWLVKVESNISSPVQKFRNVKHLTFHNWLTFIKFWIGSKTSVSLFIRFTKHDTCTAIPNDALEILADLLINNYLWSLVLWITWYIIFESHGWKYFVVLCQWIWPEMFEKSRLR